MQIFSRSVRTQYGRESIGAQFESVESRRMLSAAISHGVLTIEGTRRSDTIVLTMDTSKTLRVRIGNVESTFLKKSFSQIRISGGLGDDLVTIGSDATPITLPASVSGGDGDDTLISGTGNDSCSGGNGADQITGAGGDDVIDGDNGNDDLHGGDGRDSVCGGRGDDRLQDDSGRDSVFGNAGNDLIYFHDDEKQFRDLATNELNFAEPIFSVPKNRTTGLMMNHTPLNSVGGGNQPGALVCVGGSTLVMAGPVLDQWKKAGLATSDATVPHFDLPGSPKVSGSLTSDSTYSGSMGSTTITGGAVLTLNSVGGDFSYEGDPNFSNVLANTLN